MPAHYPPPPVQMPPMLAPSGQPCQCIQLQIQVRTTTYNTYTIYLNWWRPNMNLVSFISIFLNILDSFIHTLGVTMLPNARSNTIGYATTTPFFPTSNASTTTTTSTTNYATNATTAYASTATTSTPKPDDDGTNAHATTCIPASAAMPRNH